jgi:mitochondrial import receptor subunit TOM40
MLARVSQDGQVEGRLHRVVSQGGDGQPSVSGKFMVVASPDKAGGNDQCVVDVDVAAGTWTGCAKFGTMAGGNYAALNFLQSVTPSLAVGGDATYIGAQNVAVGNYGARYTGPNWVGSAQWSGMQGALSANYKRTVTRGVNGGDRVAIGAELQVSAALESTVTLGGEFNLKQSKIQTTIDGTGCMKTTLETKLGPGSTLVFSAEADHSKDAYRFGYGLNVGG